MSSVIKKNRMTFLFILSAICFLIVGFAIFPLPEPKLSFSFYENINKKSITKYHKTNNLATNPVDQKKKALSSASNSGLTPTASSHSASRKVGEKPTLTKSNQDKAISEFSNFDEYNAYFDRRKQHCLDNAKINFDVRACMDTRAQREEDISELIASVEENLTEEQLSLFHKSVSLWKQLENIDRNLARILINKKYPTDGTMYVDMKMGDISRSSEVIMKSRLKMLFLFLDFSKTFDDSGL